MCFNISHGHFYTIPTKSEIVADGQDGLWLTQFKGGKKSISLMNLNYELCIRVSHEITNHAGFENRCSGMML